MPVGRAVGVGHAVGPAGIVAQAGEPVAVDLTAVDADALAVAQVGGVEHPVRTGSRQAHRARGPQLAPAVTVAGPRRSAAHV